ncbi:MAG: glycosyl transferase family 1 [Anaerolineae bacterium]|nr:MAG: glycosyl transferase family 1 [Anaerolineae bacterium]
MAEPRLVYLSNNRLPTEKAHGLQIVQMCEALADAGYAVTLVAPRRFNTRELRGVRSLWDHYGVRRNFAFTRLPCLDLLPLFPRHAIGFLAQTLTYLLAVLAWLPFQRADVLYTRDLFIGAALALVRPRTPLVYEVHQVHHSRLGRWLQGMLARRAHVVAITGYLADHMRALGTRRVLVAHDGFRAARFADLPSRAEARAACGLPHDAFVIGYVGRLHTMGMSKGLDTLVDAIAQIAQEGMPPDLLLVGGPSEGVQAVREQWAARGLSPERLHTPGQVPAEAVPRYLAAMDVGTLPLPWTEHFAYHASALKLFEYMAAGCVVLASDLPGIAEVVREGETALLVPAGDVMAWAAAIRRLRDDPALRERLGAAAQQEAQRYTWAARAARIRAYVEGEG